MGRKKLAKQYIEDMTNCIPTFKQVGLTKIYFVAKRDIMTSICKSNDLIHWEGQPQNNSETILAEGSEISDFRFPNAFIACVSDFDIPIACKLECTCRDDAKLILYYDESVRPDMLLTSLSECIEKYEHM